jgi:UDP-N-acetylglucosamine 2-epimerase (non-hydrolysing)
MKIAVCFGTRPEAIKLAPVIYKLRDNNELMVMTTGQHDELLRQVTDFFDIELDFNLGGMCAVPDTAQLLANITKPLDKIFKSESPDLLIIQGDTLSVYQAALIAFLNKIPVFHVEAGLRTDNKFSPFPEEMLRALVGRLADFHFAPTIRAKNNLFNEGIDESRIFVTGNTVVDSLLLAKKKLNEDSITKELLSLNFPLDMLSPDRRNILITAHRRENIGQQMHNICRAIKQLADNHIECNFIWPLHKNPEVRGIILSEFADPSPNLILIEPVSYQVLVYLMSESFMILTDSGGIQEEAPTFNVPALVLRDTTERQELIENGNGLLIGEGVPTGKIIDYFEKLFHDKDYYQAMAEAVNPFGDGLASERIGALINSAEMQDFVNNYRQNPNKYLSFQELEISEFETRADSRQDSNINIGRNI